MQSWGGRIVFVMRSPSFTIPAENAAVLAPMSRNLRDDAGNFPPPPVRMNVSRPPTFVRGFPVKISMYQASVPRFINILGNLSKILDKAEAHADARKLDPSVLPNDRLFPDMLPMKSQVQIACDGAKGVVARLAGVEIPIHEDTEKTLAELKARIAKAVAFIESVRPEQIDGTEDKEIVIKRGEKETRYTGMQFLLGHALPNFYFHVTTAYNILRHNGIEIGKRDYIGNP
jgi:hypothetical protein